jgi:periplasmic divalent cation tolerance protein
MTMGEACVILTTTDSDEEARRISMSLVEAGLAACVQRLDIGSVYTWEGAVEEGRETLLLVKTSVDRYPQVEAWIRRNHSYQVPEVLMIRVDQGAAPYLEWLQQATGGSREDHV